MNEEDCGHVSRHKESVGRLLLWSPEEPRRRGRPNTTIKDVLCNDTGLNIHETLIVKAYIEKIGEKTKSCHRTNVKVKIKSYIKKILFL